MGRHKIDYSLLLYEHVGVLEVRLSGKSYKYLAWMNFLRITCVGIAALD